MSGTAELVTIAEAAARLQVDPKTVRRWIADGRLTAYRLGSHLIRVDATELDALLRPIPAARAAHHDQSAPSVAAPVPVLTRAQMVCTGHFLLTCAGESWTVPLFAAPIA